MAPTTIPNTHDLPGHKRRATGDVLNARLFLMRAMRELDVPELRDDQAKVALAIAAIDDVTDSTR